MKLGFSLSTKKKLLEDEDEEVDGDVEIEECGEDFVGASKNLSRTVNYLVGEADLQWLVMADDDEKLQRKYSANSAGPRIEFTDFGNTALYIFVDDFTPPIDISIKALQWKPDYYAIFRHHRIDYDFFVLEVKTLHGNLSQKIDSDYVKLLNEIQYILNKLLDANVKTPVTFGIIANMK
ncbi:hypothetical protein [Parasitella parasitica]|uniref:Uncharacterized protein n=1 Tax=Parasitella parasitica TaxID=35722 RepID=A0A0B7NDT7_9FUNG|nr:hypothetical protein [Parasitella parasitica]